MYIKGIRKNNPRVVYIEVYRKFYNIPSQSMYIWAGSGEMGPTARWPHFEIPQFEVRACNITAIRTPVFELPYLSHVRFLRNFLFVFLLMQRRIWSCQSPNFDKNVQLCPFHVSRLICIYSSLHFDHWRKKKAWELCKKVVCFNEKKVYFTCICVCLLLSCCSEIILRVGRCGLLQQLFLRVLKINKDV